MCSAYFRYKYFYGEAVGTCSGVSVKTQIRGHLKGMRIYTCDRAYESESSPTAAQVLAPKSPFRLRYHCHLLCIAWIVRGQFPPLPKFIYDLDEVPILPILLLLRSGTSIMEGVDVAVTSNKTRDPRSSKENGLLNSGPCSWLCIWVRSPQTLLPLTFLTLRPPSLPRPEAPRLVPTPSPSSPPPPSTSAAAPEHPHTGH